MNHSELVKSKEKTDKQSSKDINNLVSAKIRQDKLDKQTAKFLDDGGKVQEVEFGTMKADTKGYTALRINHEQVADGFKPKT